jgi:hypothetical protein
MDDVIAKIVATGEKRLVNVVAQRVFARAGVNLRVSAERVSTASVHTIDQLRQIIQAAAETEVQKAQVLFDAESIARLIEEEETVCQSALASRNVDEILKVFEAKAMIWELCKMAGCANPQGMLKAVTRHLKPEDFPPLKRLKDKVAALLH